MSLFQRIKLSLVEFSLQSIDWQHPGKFRTISPGNNCEHVAPSVGWERSQCPGMLPKRKPQIGAPRKLILWPENRIYRWWIKIGVYQKTDSIRMLKKIVSSVFKLLNLINSKIGQMGMNSLMVLTWRIWSFLVYVLKMRVRTVRQHQTIKYDILPLSPISSHRLNLVKRKTLVLDLDETLIHSQHDGIVGRQTVKPGTPPDFVLKVIIEHQPVRFYVHKRPHVDYFLNVVSEWYELVVFTASMEIYGQAVADRLDNERGILRRRFFRQDCTFEYGSYTKDLSKIVSDLSSVFILDNSPGAYRTCPDNAIPIKSWFCDPSDTALLNLLPVLDALRFTNDVRSVLSRNLHLHKMW